MLYMQLFYILEKMDFEKCLPQNSITKEELLSAVMCISIKSKIEG